MAEECPRANSGDGFTSQDSWATSDLSKMQSKSPQESSPFADETFMAALGSALRIIQQASASVDQTASRLARPVDLSGNGDVVDLSAEMIALLQAKNATAVGVQLARTVDDLQQTTLSLLG